jgi:hypothetical protein
MDEAKAVPVHRRNVTRVNILISNATAGAVQGTCGAAATRSSRIVDSQTALFG